MNSSPVGDALQVADDDLGLVVVGESREEVDLVEVGLVADAEQGRQAQLARRRPVEDGRAQGARLREHRDAACLGHVVGERSVHLVVRVEQTETVGAHEAGAGGTAESGDLALERRAILVDLFEARGDNDDGLGLRLEGADDGSLDGGGRHADDAHVDGLAILVEACVELLSHELAAGRVDGHDFALESSLDEVGYDRVTDLARGAGCPHDRYALWIQEKLKHMPTTSLRCLPLSEDRKRSVSGAPTTNKRCLAKV